MIIAGANGLTEVYNRMCLVLTRYLFECIIVSRLGYFGFPSDRCLALSMPKRVFISSEWDTCATHVIVEQAGGTVLRYDGSGERGLADIALLLEGTAEGSTDAGGSCFGDLRLAYNKADLSSPYCLFLGNCTAR